MPQPAARLARPKSSAVRTTSSAPPGSSSRPSVALAVTRVSPCSSPSRSRRAQPPDRVVVGRGRDPHVVAVDARREAAGVVGPRVERAAAGQVEAGVVPVAGEQAGLDRCRGGAGSRGAGSGPRSPTPARRATAPPPAASPTLVSRRPSRSEVGERAGPHAAVAVARRLDRRVRGDGHRASRDARSLGHRSVPCDTPALASNGQGLASEIRLRCAGGPAHRRQASHHRPAEAGRHRRPRPSWPRSSGSPTPPCASTSRRWRRTGSSSGRRRRRPSGRGRPPVRWQLTPLAGELFPDRHADLTVELIGSIREALGDDGLDKVLEARAAGPARRLPQGTPRSGRHARARAGAPPGRRPQRRGLPGRGARRRRRQPPARRAPLPGVRGRRAPARACAAPSWSCSRPRSATTSSVERVQHLLVGRPALRLPHHPRLTFRPPQRPQPPPPSPSSLARRSCRRCARVSRDSST